MIGKARTGANFRGLQAYLLTGKEGQEQHRVAWATTGGLPGDEPELAAEVMEATAQQNQRVTKPVYHLTVSLPPSESLSREDLQQVAETTLRDLGLEDHQALFVAHLDRDHQHVHIMVNRVHPTSLKAWHTGHDYARIESSLRRQELELQLRRVPGRHAAGPGKERHVEVRLSSGDRLQAERTGHQTFAGHVRVVAREELQQASSWGDLHRRLEGLGLHAKKRGRGLVLTDGERQVKASFVDRGSSLPKLEARLGKFAAPSRDLLAGKSERWRDIQEIRDTSRDLTRHQERLSQRPADDRAAELRLEADFKTLYRDPEGARAAFVQAIDKKGLKHAAGTLATTPQKFGQLRPGPSMPTESPLEIAARAAGAASRLTKIPSKLSRTIPLARASLRTLSAVAESGRTPARLPMNLTQKAQRLVERLGWKLAARVVPLPQLQLLRIAVSLAKRTAHVVLETARTVSR